MKIDLISVEDTKDYILKLFSLAEKFKRDRKSRDILKNKTIALIFEKPSLRTRVTFEVAVTQLGGSAIYLSKADILLGEREPIKDVARNLALWVSGIVARTYSHESIIELAKYSKIPVINALSDLEHPCQALADLFTIKEVKESFDTTLAFVGDGNNVCNSLILASSLLGVNIIVACPKGYEPNKEILERAKKYAKEKGSMVEITHDPTEAVKKAEFVYTDVWVSMGQENEREQRLEVFRDFQVNSRLLSYGHKPYVMHCLPARRGEEITDEVIESEKSLVLRQAENRLHVQKAILSFLFSHLLDKE